MTLNEIWQNRDSTMICLRPGRDIQISCAHDTIDDALRDAIKDWPITMEDVFADDWYTNN